jgi:YesN/AraC family two-component response regulator
VARIIIADDEFVVALQMKQRLGALGYDVLATAASGRECVEKTGQLKPDLVLMDVVMPGELDGFDAAALIREHDDIPVVFVSAYTDAEFIHRAKEVQAYGYITKPFHEGELEAAIELALCNKETENGLKRNKKRLRTILDEFDGLLCICSSEHRIEFVNRSLRERTGYDPTGEACHRALHGLEEKCPWCPADRVLEGGKVRQIVESPFDGRRYYLAAVPLNWPEGKISVLVVMIAMEDIQRAQGLPLEFGEE